MVDESSEKVCAVVVTYNRKQLLIECLEALRSQTRPIQAIYLIDNASTDKTPELLKDRGYIFELPPENINEPWEQEFSIQNLTDGNIIKLHYVRMNTNTGGAGGFYEGVKRGYERGYDWLWLMDDDTIACNDALLFLFDAINKIPKEEIGFICSKVLYTDKSIHFMNIPNIKPIVGLKPFNIYDNENLLLVESASFVSLLVHKKIVKKIGYPIKEFFIWADDVEFTKRITKYKLGIYYNKSIVIHKTMENYSAASIKNKRIFYNIRNQLFIQKKENIFKFFIKFIIQLFNSFRYPGIYFIYAIKGCFSSLYFNPKIKYPKD